MDRGFGVLVLVYGYSNFESSLLKSEIQPHSPRE